MEKVIKLTMLIGITLVSFTACDKERVIETDELPSNARTYIALHFPDYEIIQVVKERDDLKTTYQVFLDEGFELDFDKKGVITSVEGTNKLPDSVIPDRILAYVNVTYPDDFVVGWELDGAGQEIKLSNRMELKFDKDDNFLRID